MGQRRTQRDCSDAAGITEVTIRNRYKEIVALLDINLEV
jgi:transcription initiation factor TFIIB